MELFCRICGELIEPEGDTGVCECEYCGSRQTFPLKYGEKQLDSYNKACRLRMKTDFEGAEKLLVQLCEEVPDEPEAFWELVLCRCGIVYEDDGQTSVKKPVCRRVSLTPLNEDEDYLSALVCATDEQKAVYCREAAALEVLRSEYVQKVGNGEKYDVFMCFSPDSEKDSVAASEIYEQLTAEGYRVFLSPQSADTDDEQRRELIISAAIKSAHTLIVVCTRADDFAVPPLKSEWSRCASAAHRDGDKLLVTCIADMDEGDVPEELSAYNVMEMGGIGFVAELIRLIRSKNADKNVTVRTAPEKLIRRMNIFLADEDFEAAEEYCDLILDASPECWQAHWARFLIYNGCRSSGDLLLEEVVNSFAADYVERFGYDFAEDDAFDAQFASMLGDMPAKALKYAEGDEKLNLVTVYERFVNAVRDAVFAKEQEEIDVAEKQELDAIRRRRDEAVEQRNAAELKKQSIRSRFLTYAAVIFTVLIILFVKFRFVWAAVLIIIMLVVTVLVLGGLNQKD